MAYFKDIENRPHHVIFEDLGKVSTGVININIAIPLNISIMSKQIDMFSGFLDSLTVFDSFFLDKLSAKDTATAHSME